MLVSAISKDQIYQITLPEKVRGQYWLYSDDSCTNKIVSIEAIDDEWVAKSNKKYKIIGGEKKVLKTKKLLSMQLITISSKFGKCFIFCEPVTEDRQIFTKYLFKNSIKLNIGRDEKNDIVFSSKVVSSQHALLTCANGRWDIKDVGSANGVFVNGKRVIDANLKYGDLILIMGLKIVVGKNFIALNNPDNRVKVTEKLFDFVPQNIDLSDNYDEDEDKEDSDEYFYRSPRFKRDIETYEINVEIPPTSPIADEMPMGLVLGSSMAMGLMSVVTLSNAIVTQNFLTMAMGASMLIGTLLIPIITKVYEKRRKRKKEILRQKKYHEYLDKIAVEINEECQKQTQILHENVITVKECEDRILNIERNLWERSSDHNDFLRLRVGLGNIDPDIRIHYPGKKFSIEDDNLQEELYVLAEKKKTLKNVPISYSLYDDYISGIIGNREDTINFAKGLIFQLASMYSYDEVKFIFFYDKQDSSSLDFVKWLPHVWSDDHKFRFIAKSDSESKEISAYLAQEVEARLDMNENDVEDVSPYYIIFSFSKLLSVRSEMIKNVISSKDNICFSVVTLYDELKNLPKECSMVVELNKQKSRLYDKNDISGHFVEFSNDNNITNDANRLSCSLANTILDTAATNFTLPSMVTFLKMFGVGKIEHLNALDRWRENDPTASLEAAVGVDTLGGLFKLDLHEKFHGPHGLVAGTTGSGKSEFIISYILSLAINYHPEEVAFILIDYKGGGMAKSFEHLPHTVGIITNLDGSAIKRSLVSIESELKRRQAIFAEASKKVQISNIDIYKYQKLYREGMVDEPLQHLFIISDEFAELKTQQPEFMTQLVSAARIGRSLGVHLILATQKPSGVVDDQIWSNSRFKVCLKVQDKADSMDMLKRPDAAELSETGRFYLQVGYNELFELGQSAWSGAPYYPSDTVLKERDISVSFIDTNGLPYKSGKLDNRKTLFKNPPKQVDAITEYLRKIADEENIHVRPLWLDPIPAMILVDDLYKKYKLKTTKFCLEPLIGEYDDPARQRQMPLTLPLTKNGNAIFYGAAGSGKTTFVNAVVYSLITKYSPDEVNLYLLDFASETLGMFKNAPHVGDVMLAYEEEKIINTFKMLTKELNKRKRMFADFGGDYSSFIENSQDKMPSIVVIINNFTAFSEIYTNLEDYINLLSREGTKYGIHYILTSTGVNGVRFRLLQNFKQLFALQLNDDADYSSVVGKTDGLFPSKIKGRGLVKLDMLYEFQAAHIVKDNSLRDYIMQKSIELNTEYDGQAAKKIPVLPDKVDEDFLKEYIVDENSTLLPIGVDCNSLNVYHYNFDKHYINLVCSVTDDYSDFAQKLTSLISNYTNHEVYALHMPNISEFENNKNLHIARTLEDCKKMISDIFDLSVKRNNKYADAKDKNKAIKSFKPIFVIVDSLSTIFKQIDGELKEKLQLFLDKGSIECQIYYIITDQSATISVYSYDTWFKNNVSNSNGIWIGNGIADQYILKPTKIDASLRQSIPEGFAYVLNNGNTLKIKILSKYEAGDSYGE